MKEKFCTSCQTHRDIENGRFHLRGKIKRWICNSCLDKKSVSFITGKTEQERQAKLSE